MVLILYKKRNKKASSRRGGGKFQGTDFNKLVPEQHL